MDIIKILALQTLDYSEQFSEFWKIYWKASWKCFHPKNYRSNITNKGCCGFRCLLSKKNHPWIRKIRIYDNADDAFGIYFSSNFIGLDP